MQEILGRNIAKGIDSKNISFNPALDVGSYISTLGEFEELDSDPIAVQRFPNQLLQFYTIGFLVRCSSDMYQELLTKTGELSLLSSERGYDDDVLIIFGNLEDWRTVIINGCNSRSSLLMQEFCTQVLLYFDSIGLMRIFYEYSRNVTSNKTLLLSK